MTESSEWQGRIGESWAQEYRRTDRSFTALTERLLFATRGKVFDTALDIGCGAGELSLAIARGRSGVTVTGIDISPDLVIAAQRRNSKLGNVTFEVADASKWKSEPTHAPQLLVSRHGVMFFPDPAIAFANLAHQSAPNADLVFSCFRARSENPLFTEVTRLLPQPADPTPDNVAGPFGFADPLYIETILSLGGWTEMEITPFDFPMIAGAGENADDEAIAYFSRIGPAALPISEMEAGARDRFLERLRSLIERYRHDSMVTFPAAAWIVSAKRA